MSDDKPEANGPAPDQRVGGVRHRRRRRLRSMSVTARLLALALVPLVGMLVMAAGTMRTRADTARSAAEVDRTVARLTKLVALRSALFEERAYTDSVALVRAHGLISVEQAVAFTGYNLADRVRDCVVRSDAALAALGPEDAGVVSPADLAAARQGVDTQLMGEATQTRSFVPNEERLEAAQERLLAVLGPHLEMTGGNRVADGLTAVRLETEIVTTFVDQLRATNHLFTATGDETRLKRQALAAQVTQRRAFEELTHLSDPGVVAAAAALENDAATRAYLASMDALVEGTYPRVANFPDDWKRLTEINTTGMEYSSRTFDGIQRSMATAAAAASELSTEARQELGAWAVYTGALGVASLLISVLLARSITRPLGRLRDHAAALSAGDFGVGALPDGGPRDIEVTSRTFNDLVGNLRLLEAKTRALADLDFEAQALAEPLPGELGRSLQRSLRTLSGSISERDELRSHILHQASHDALTGLPNRSAAIEELAQALARAKRLGRGLGVALVDIDDFKRVNDTHGHSFGDQVLVVVARRLAHAAPGSSLVARVGGDEFLVLVEDLADAEPLITLARNLTVVLDRPSHVAGVTVTATVSVGLAFSWNGKDQPDQLLAGADLAVARAKRRAPGSVEIHDRALQEQLVAQAAIEDALAPALRRDDELFLQYQPVIELGTGRMSSVEALIRWNRPGVGVQPPDTFIPVAERSNLIVDLDRWVLARAAGQLAQWRADPNLRAIDVAVNVSGRHLLGGALHHHVAEMLAATRTDPRRLIVELTETALVHDLAVAAAQLEAVRGLGVRIAIDDFGTGYTSIAHLRQLPVDIIKIDRSFVSRLDAGTDRALLRMITELGHELGTTITAEGVETAGQYQLLRALGCDRAQGYLLSRPLAPADLVDWAAGRQPAARR